MAGLLAKIVEVLNTGSRGPVVVMAGRVSDAVLVATSEIVLNAGEDDIVRERPEVALELAKDTVKLAFDENKVVVGKLDEIAKDELDISVDKPNGVPLELKEAELLGGDVKVESEEEGVGIKRELNTVDMMLNDANEVVKTIDDEGTNPGVAALDTERDRVNPPLCDVAVKLEIATRFPPGVVVGKGRTRNEVVSPTIVVTVLKYDVSCPPGNMAVNVTKVAVVTPKEVTVVRFSSVEGMIGLGSAVDRAPVINDVDGVGKVVPRPPGMTLVITRMILDMVGGGNSTDDWPTGAFDLDEKFMDGACEFAGTRSDDIDGGFMLRVEVKIVSQEFIMVFIVLPTAEAATVDEVGPGVPGTTGDPGPETDKDDSTGTRDAVRVIEILEWLGGAMLFSQSVVPFTTE